MIDLNVKNSWPSWLRTRVLFLQKDEKGYSVSSIITRELRRLFISLGHVTILIIRYSSSDLRVSHVFRRLCKDSVTLFESSAEYSEIISIKKYSIVQKLDHLACRPNAIFKLQSYQFNGFIEGNENCAVFGGWPTIGLSKSYKNQLRVDWEIGKKHAIYKLIWRRVFYRLGPDILVVHRTTG